MRAFMSLLWHFNTFTLHSSVCVFAVVNKYVALSIFLHLLQLSLQRPSVTVAWESWWGPRLPRTPMMPRRRTMMMRMLMMWWWRQAGADPARPVWRSCFPEEGRSMPLHISCSIPTSLKRSVPYSHSSLMVKWQRYSHDVRLSFLLCFGINTANFYWFRLFSWKSYSTKTIQGGHCLKQELKDRKCWNSFFKKVIPTSIW